MIREYKKEDKKQIDDIGQLIKSDYIFKESEQSKCLVFEENNIVVGFMVYLQTEDNVEIYDIAVKEEYQQNAIGTKLLTYLELAIQASCSKIILEVRSDNEKAISFYLGKGFIKKAVRKKYYQDGENALIMIKELW